MRKVIIFNALLLVSVVVMAQDTNKVTVKPYGFIRNYLTFDSRKTYTVIGGEYNMIPFDEKWNEDHSEDLNAVPNMQLQALTSRFGIDVQGLSIGRWGSSGKLEGDFGGFGTNNTVLRLRLAYVKLNHEGMEFLIGQDWHPLSGNIMPDVLGMAAGAPFRPHSRTPQIRATRYWGNFGMTAALLYQLQYMNNGPSSPSDPSSTSSVNYALNALWPEAYLGIGFRNDNVRIDLGVDAQILRPRTHALIGGTTVKVDETVKSFTPTLYTQYANGMWSIKFRTLLAQNTSHLNQLVGYGVTGVNSDGSWNYEPMRASISYLDVAYGKKRKANVFFGYMKNLGVSGNLYDLGTAVSPLYYIYMKGGDYFICLNSIYRVSPSMSYNFKAFSIGIEYEWTAATYGDLQSDGTIANNANLHVVNNHRICAMVRYNF